MYACNQCHRSYTNRNSLTRHVHSHETSKKHQCSVCNVIFYRKDLLSRHSKLHRTPRERNATSESPSALGNLGASGGRRRCHTACLRCRELRTKCDGNRPCFSCQGTGQDFTFPSPSNRLSHIPIESEQSSQLEAEPIQDLQAHSDRPPTVPDELANIPPNYDFEGAEAFIVDMESWPWMHGSLYLPTDSSAFANPANSMQINMSGDGEPLLHTFSGTDLHAFFIDPGLNPTAQSPDMILDSPARVVEELLSFATATELPTRTSRTCSDY
jgi:hypothetical protein